MEAWVSLKTGEVVVSNGHESEEYDELPEDLGEPGRYVEGPRARELDLGARLVMRFVAERMADAVDEVSGYFRSRGAYRPVPHGTEEARPGHGMGDVRACGDGGRAGRVGRVARVDVRGRNAGRRFPSDQLARGFRPPSRGGLRLTASRAASVRFAPSGVPRHAFDEAHRAKGWPTGAASAPRRASSEGGPRPWDSLCRVANRSSRRYHSPDAEASWRP